MKSPKGVCPANFMVSTELKVINRKINFLKGRVKFCRLTIFNSEFFSVELKQKHEALMTEAETEIKNLQHKLGIKV